MLPISKQAIPSSEYTSSIVHKVYVLSDINDAFSHIYVQEDAMLHSLFYMETALHVSGGTSTHNQELKQLYLQHLVLSHRYCYLPL
jgi:hypothetical protein